MIYPTLRIFIHILQLQLFNMCQFNQLRKRNIFNRINSNYHIITIIYYCFLTNTIIFIEKYRYWNILKLESKEKLAFCTRQLFKCIFDDFNLLRTLVFKYRNHDEQLLCINYFRLTASLSGVALIMSSAGVLTIENQRIKIKTRHRTNLLITILLDICLKKYGWTQLQLCILISINIHN